MLRAEREAPIRLSRYSHPALAHAIDVMCDSIDLVLSHLRSGKPVQKADLNQLEEANHALRKLFPHKKSRSDLFHELWESFFPADE